MKYKILMFPSWYPTKENPINGSFFREQALALSDLFDLYIVHFSYKLSIIRRKYFEVSIDFSDEKLPQLFIVIYFFSIERILQKFFDKFNLLYKIEKVHSRQKEKAFVAINKYLNCSCNFKADLIYAMTAQINGIDAYNFGKINNIPVVLAEHAPFPLVGTIITDELRDAISNCNRILAVSYDKARQILMQNIQCNPIIVGNMVDESVFQSLNEKPDLFTILIVAAYNFYKDYDTFFRVIAHLRQITILPFKVKIVGYMPLARESIWVSGEKCLLEHLNHYGLKDICELIPKVQRDEMVNIYNQSNVFVTTSIQEGMSVAALEALCCGIPVFSTRCGGVEDYIDGDCGYLFNIQDWESIAMVLKAVLEGKLIFDHCKIRENVITRYGKRAFCERIYSIFTKVIEESSLRNDFIEAN